MRCRGGSIANLCLPENEGVHEDRLPGALVLSVG